MRNLITENKLKSSKRALIVTSEDDICVYLGDNGIQRKSAIAAENLNDNTAHTNNPIVCQRVNTPGKTRRKVGVYYPMTSLGMR